MDFFDLVRQRHSYRGPYRPDPVPREHLKQIVSAGLLAPSGCNAQTTSFVIVDDPAAVAAIAGILDRPVAKGAPAFIVCIADHRAIYKGCSFAVEDCAAATQNILLAITALGYASVWLDGVLRVDQRQKKIAALLGIPEDREVRIILPVGIPEEPLVPKPKFPFDQRAWFNRFGP